MYDYINANNEIDFIVEDEHLAIQVTYDMSNEDTQNRELTPLFKFQTQHPDWTCVVITNDDSQTYTHAKQTLQAIPAYKWLLRE